MRTILLLCFLNFIFLITAHEGHREKSFSPTENIQNKIKETTKESRPTTWTQWIGSFHLIFLHFPITLINLLFVSEILLIWFKQPIFEFSSKFLVISAAILSPPTALLGLIYSYSASYRGLMETFLLWHMWLGISTAIMALAVSFIRESLGRGILYYVSLFLLFLLANIAGYFGGGMTFGPYHMYPPL